MTFAKIENLILNNYKKSDEEFTKILEQNKIKLLDTPTRNHTSGIFKAKKIKYYFSIQEYYFNSNKWQIVELENPIFKIELLI